MTGEQLSLPFTLMRGGTSKAVFLRGSDLPPPGPSRDRMILRLFGSPDPRQIDGLGGADILTSKLAIIDPPSRPDVDLDYTFAQVSVSEPFVDYDIMCGNISSAVGAFAVDEALVGTDQPEATVRIFNTNTGRIFRAVVQVNDGRAAVDGDCAIAGVPGTGAPIALDLSGTFGSETGVLLPTGNVMDEMDSAIGPVEVSIVDLASLCVFFEAAAVGMRGTEGPAEATSEHVAAVVAVKEAVATLLGLAPDALTPIPSAVAAPQDYVGLGKAGPIAATEVDLVARVIGGRPPMLHKAYPGASAACTGVAARIPGTVVARVAEQQDPTALRIGHTSGVMAVSVAVKEAVATLLGLVPDALTPIPSAVAAPQDYVGLGKAGPIAATEVDLVARVIGGRPPMLHKAYPGASAACTGVAARIPGTVVARVAEQQDPTALRIGHTSGVMAVSVVVNPDGDSWHVERAAYDRTARRIAEGTALVPSDAAGTVA